MSETETHHYYITLHWCTYYITVIIPNVNCPFHLAVYLLDMLEKQLSQHSKAYIGEQTDIHSNLWDRVGDKCLLMHITYNCLSYTSGRGL